jgi:hypothetical protein
LQVQIKSGHHVVSGLRRGNEFLRCFFAVLVERQFVFAVLAGKHVVERLFESFASLRLWPNRFVVIDNAVRIPARFSGVTNNVTGDLSVRIDSYVNRPHHHSGWQLVLDSVVFLRREIGCDLKRHDAPVAVMTKDRLFGNPEPASY